jgi:hypothetical protein
VRRKGEGEREESDGYREDQGLPSRECACLVSLRSRNSRMRGVG